ncbi:uncharacterized protein DUF4442 [Sinobacterium caligoides]|uniref:Uncharacterized protein DUF4442 n=1 Tax=Sinobacterium caligoides TaxID=933926 RepID=A0A3N2DMI3_9GAMM|nr:DUF4442 domain-containing protein [Sinobacterium caligoides]ROS01017.1 uncharacterized protein DUF4442 [Sinobacterium caligoides]
MIIVDGVIIVAVFSLLIRYDYLKQIVRGLTKVVSSSFKKSMLRGIYERCQKLPEALRSKALSFIFARVVKFFGTAKLRFELMTPTRSIVHVRNRKRVQNHIGSVHAVAMGLISESATGAIVGLNVSADSIPVLKSMHIDYLKRAVGDLRAEAWLTDEQVVQMNTEPKGETTVACKVTDAEGKEPIAVTMVWAWTPARR